MTILVLNAGSSSLKYGLFDRQVKNQLSSGVIEGTHYQAMVAKVFATLQKPDDIEAVGHRVVHGGIHFRSPVRINQKVKKTLRALTELAPLHNPPAIETLQVAEKMFPAIPHVAVFDTAFYHDLPPSQYIYPLPYAWYRRWGVRRFGFHGISYAYCVPKAAEILKKNVRTISLIACHLGNGCSVTAIRDGKAVATTMGMTPLEGLMMGSRAGSVDPGLLLYLQRAKGMSAGHLEKSLNHESGLLGVSGISSDYRVVAKAAWRGHVRSRLALEIYANRIRAAIGALATTLDRVDALVFTAGVGEHDAALRAAVCKGLMGLALQLDPQKNKAGRSDTDIAAKNSSTRVLIIHTREECLIARETRRFLRMV